MRTSRYSTSRQKACLNCSTAKAKCDRRTGRCTRCTRRGLQCMYPQATSSDGPYSPVPDALGPEPEDGLSANGSAEYSDLAPAKHMAVPEAIPYPPASLSSRSYSTAMLPGNGSLTLEGLNFSSLELTCPIDVNEITTRWMKPYIPGPGEKIKSYPTGVVSFITRMLKSYAAVATRGRGMVPFIHFSQIRHSPSSPLTTCLRLVRMCQNPLFGSEDAAAVIIQREMENITALRESYDDMSLLAAFQAYIVYTMVLFFRLSQAGNSHLRQAMINLQELAHVSCRQGLVCAADQHRTRPRWEEWIVTEAKRRTLSCIFSIASYLPRRVSLPILVPSCMGSLHLLPSLYGKRKFEEIGKGSITSTWRSGWSRVLLLMNSGRFLRIWTNSVLPRDGKELIIGWKVLMNLGLCSMRL